MNENKQRKIRDTHRNLLNKLIEEIDDYCSKTEHSVICFEEFLDKLNTRFNVIKELDNNILSLINAKNVENEVLNIDEYDQKVISYRCKLNFKIKSLCTNANVVNSSNIDSVRACPVSTEYKKIKLPKLQISKFFGEPDKFLEFWNEFETAIDKNPSLTDVEKFSYLKSLVAGSAANTISGFSLTENNYAAAVSLLKERFGRHDMLVHAHLNNLLNMKGLKSSYDTYGLRCLYDKCQTQIRNLESLGVKSDTYSGLLCPILLKLIPPDLTLEFNRHLKNGEMWNIDNLMSFLKNEIESRERVLTIHDLDSKKSFFNDNKNEYKQKFSDKQAKFKSKYQYTTKGYKQNNVSTELMASVNKNSCIFCNSVQHNSEFCESLTLDEKKELIKKQGRCLLCLKPKHRIKECVETKMCDICDKKHNRAICFQLENHSKVNVDKSVVSISHCDNTSTSKVPDENTHCNIFLQTCSAIIKDLKTDKNEPVRILLDNGSMRTFIIRDISQKLKLPVIRKETLSVYAFGAEKATEKTYNVVKVKLENRDQPFLNIEIEALETDQISAACLPTPDKYIRKSYNKLKGLQLADSYEYSNQQIAVLIGTDNYYNIVTGRIKRLKDNLVATETLFGWCLQGYMGSTNELFSMKIIVEEKNLSEQIREFWQLESLGIESETQAISNVDNDVISDFESSIVFKDNRYKVKFPWKKNLKRSLNNNREVAHRRFLKLRTNFRNDPSLFSEYKSILDSYLAENIIEPVENSSDVNTFYLPHRAVIREDKSTTKLRIVFDASAHSKGELSLNDCLYTGLNLIPDLFSLLIKFRNLPIAVTADIQQAFLQIEIAEEDRDFTRFFWDDEPWVEDPGKELKIYRLKRVLFGVKSSPFLLAATIKHHLRRYVEKFPESFDILNSSLYVDDFISSTPNVESAFKLTKEAYEIFREASMIFRKWKSNSYELRQKWEQYGLHTEDTADNFNLSNQHLVNSKVLGVSWDPDNDTLSFRIHNMENFLSKRLNTKRYLLQTVGRIFDPIGFLSPYTIRIKCLIQEVWCLGLDWDENLPKHLDNSWNAWFEEIRELNSISIPRYYLSDIAPDEVDYFELHSFSDASKKAYGTVVYLRAALKNKSIVTSFVAAKSRVAPLKTVSIPRLELLGALLSARLSHKIAKELVFPVSCYFWTDSTITLYWIKGDTERFKMFVRNRIKEIRNLSDPSNWFHCPGQDNPADFVTRGLKVPELKNSHLWWEGPQWLKQDRSLWPKLASSFDTLDISETKDELELKKNAAVKSTVIDKNQANIDLINRYSSFTKLIRVTAYCLRFLNNCKLETGIRKYNYLDTSELQNATKRLIKIVQNSAFQTEIQCLKGKRPLPNNSKLLSLNVFLDEDELLRVGGRLKFSNLAESQKHQLILPKSHYFTELLIQHYHKKFLHSGAQTTLSLLRQFYWIPSGLSQVKKVISRCITCFRSKHQTIQQIMGDLPRDRIVPSRPFEKTGVDLAGPIITKPNLKRSKIKIKSYIAIFICFSTKAVHLEVISDLTTQAFLACLRRFVSRRSKPSVIWSDNATNFKGTYALLKSFYEICASEEIQRFSADEGIKWNFIPPASPHFGGLWESNIKAMKRILLKITKSSILNFEELTTLVTQIEAVMNSRPLTPLSTDINDLQPLTPGHFLTGGPILNIPDNNEILDSLPFSSRWTLVQRLKDQFWRRWNREYLNELQVRSKWKKTSQNLQDGQLVLLKDRNEGFNNWRLARVLKTYRGDDGHVRVIDLKTSTGILRRNITAVAPLPIYEDVGQSSNAGRDVPAN